MLAILNCLKIPQVKSYGHLQVPLSFIVRLFAIAACWRNLTSHVCAGEMCEVQWSIVPNNGSFVKIWGARNENKSSAAAQRTRPLLWHNIQEKCMSARRRRKCIDAKLLTPLCVLVKNSHFLAHQPTFYARAFRKKHVCLPPLTESACPLALIT